MGVRESSLSIFNNFAHDFKRHIFYSVVHDSSHLVGHSCHKLSEFFVAAAYVEVSETLRDGSGTMV